MTPEQQDRWDLMTNPDRALEYAVRGVEAQAKGAYDHAAWVRKQREARERLKEQGK